jgi:hypothetical protein
VRHHPDRRGHRHRGLGDELGDVGRRGAAGVRVHDPATAEQHSLKGKGYITTADWHDIAWEIRLDRMKVTVDGEVRFEGPGDYAGLESTPSVGPCFGSTVSIREFSITPLA